MPPPHIIRALPISSQGEARIYCGRGSEGREEGGGGDTWLKCDNELIRDDLEGRGRVEETERKMSKGREGRRRA